MNVLSLKDHVQLTKVKEKIVNELVFKVITDACSNMTTMRDVFKGDLNTVRVSRHQKVG